MTPTRLIAAGLFSLALAGCAAELRAPSPTAAPAVVTTTVPATTTTTTTTLSIEEATLQFRSCLVDRGVVVDEIPLDARGRPRLELALVGVDFGDASAMESLTECSDLLSEGALDLTIWPRLQETVQATLESFSDCVRAHGVLAFPDPVNPFIGVGGPYPLDEIPFGDPDLEDAVAICAERVVEDGR